MRTIGYFSWETASKIEAAYELRQRAKDGRGAARTLRTDSNANCIGCGIKPKRHDRVYVPSITLGASNKVIAHAACVDRLCSEHTAKSTQEARVARTKDLITEIPETGAPKDMPVKIKELLYNVKTKAAKQREADAYWRGYEDALLAIKNG